MKKPIRISDYTYELPAERIARYPLPERDRSKLLTCIRGKIDHASFRDLPDLLPDDLTLFFNNTRVIPARLYFHKATGALIEIFLLEPVQPTPEISQAMEQRGEVVWECMIGNRKKWKSDEILETMLTAGTTTFLLQARLTDKEKGLVRFTWHAQLPFSSVIEAAGSIPLPPYLNREAEASDRERYQTIYAELQGAVAAPTAGLHFTEEVMNRLQAKGLILDRLTLHVSAGTFAPVKSEWVTEHAMHAEQIVVTRENIENMLNAAQIGAVGTTSMRTLESLYWFGVMLISDPDATFNIGQNDPYSPKITPPSREKALLAIVEYMERKKLGTIVGTTRIFIYPGYTFRMCDALITNFHQPGSTLILLVAAFIGAGWRDVYESALRENYRFLSYGDSSLLIP